LKTVQIQKNAFVVFDLKPFYVKIPAKKI